MVALDATVVSIALPHAQATLHFSSADRQWIVTAYALAFGSLLLLGGRLADIYGRSGCSWPARRASPRRPLPEARRRASRCSSPRARPKGHLQRCWHRRPCRC
jgi:hypothetical protein